MMKKLILSAFLILLVGFPGPNVLIAGRDVFITFEHARAYADDDDDDNGNAGAPAGSGSTTSVPSSSRKAVAKFKKKKKKSKKLEKNVKRQKSKTVLAKKVKKEVLQVASASELIVRNLRDFQVAEIERRGLKVIERRVQANGLTMLRVNPRNRQSLVSARNEIGAISGSLSVDFNHYYRLNTGDLCESSDCKQLKLVGLTWQQTNGCKPPLFAIIDSHVDRTNSLLARSKVELINLVKAGEKPVNDGHGTAVAALLAANGDELKGAFPGASFLAINVFHLGANGDRRADAYSLIAAIEEIRKRGIVIANLSLSGPHNDPLKQAVEEAIEGGVHIIAAAGNAGPASPALYPAGYDAVIAVTALDQKLKAYRRAGSGTHIDFAAPGVGIMSASLNNRLSRYTGTSFSAPFVTAAVIAALTEQTKLKPTETIQLLASLAKDLGPAGKDRVFGYGLVQAPATCKR